MPLYSLTKHKSTRKNFPIGPLYQQNWKEEPKHFNLICVVRLLIKILTGVAFLTKGNVNLHLFASSNEKKLQYRKGRITGLKCSLRATENICILPGLPSFYLVPFRFKQNTGKNFEMDAFTSRNQNTSIWCECVVSLLIKTATFGLATREGQHEVLATGKPHLVVTLVK